MKPIFGRPLLSEWLLDPNLCFLNHGSFGATPRVVLRKQQRLREAMEANPVRFMDVDLPPGIREQAVSVSKWLGLDPGGTVFVANATDGMNAVLRSVALRSGDRVVTTSWVYGAVEKTLRFVCERAGAELEVVPLAFPIQSEQQIVNAVCQRIEGAKLLVVDEIASKTAVRLPVEAILREARRCGVLTLVDGAHVPGQAVPCLHGDVQPDYWVGNLHKWAFAPKGAAVLWVAEAHRERVHPTIISHGYQGGLTQEFDWVGTRDPTAWLCADAGMAFLDRLGRERVWSYQKKLRREASAYLRGLWGLEPSAPDAMLCAMESFAVPFPFPGTEAASMRLNRRLRGEYHVEVPVFPLDGVAWIRISAQAYVDMSDIERLGQAVCDLFE